MHDATISVATCAHGVVPGIHHESILHSVADLVAHDPAGGYVLDSAGVELPLAVSAPWYRSTESWAVPFAFGCLNADAVSVAKAFAGACDGPATGLGLPASISFRAPRAPLCNSTIAALLTASPPRIG